VRLFACPFTACPVSPPHSRSLCPRARASFFSDDAPSGSTLARLAFIYFVSATGSFAATSLRESSSESRREMWDSEDRTPSAVFGTSLRHVFRANGIEITESSTRAANPDIASSRHRIIVSSSSDNVYRCSLRDERRKKKLGDRWTKNDGSLPPALVSRLLHPVSLTALTDRPVSIVLTAKLYRAINRFRLRDSF